MSKIEMIVGEVRCLTPLIKTFRLDPSNGGLLPGFEPGAHIRVDLPAGGDRAYSLINLDPQANCASGVPHYRVAVRLEDESTGGSRFMHQLAEGDRITIASPKNDFPLHQGDDPALLIAGGIGITPIVSMTAALAGRGGDYRLHYAGRNRGALAFVDELRELAGDRLAEHYDDEAETALDLKQLLSGPLESARIYVCGPKGMIEAVQQAAHERGLPRDRVHFELFTNQAAAADSEAFEIELASTGEVLTVPPGKTIIEVLEEAGHDILYDCQRGDCGICQTTVISGTPDHRDVVLSEEEKASGTVMQICVSRAKTPRLVLEL